MLCTGITKPTHLQWTFAELILSEGGGVEKIFVVTLFHRNKKFESDTHTCTRLSFGFVSIINMLIYLSVNISSRSTDEK